MNQVNLSNMDVEELDSALCCIEIATLTTREKLFLLQHGESSRLSGGSKARCAYRTALEAQDVQRINFIEQFGDTMRKLLENFTGHLDALKFGFFLLEKNDSGWLNHAPFSEIEKYELEHKPGHVCFNTITTGVSPNGSWVYGVSCWIGNGGYFSGLSVYSVPYPNRKAALMAGLQFVLDRHKDSKDPKELKTIKLYREALKAVAAPKLEQTSLLSTPVASQASKLIEPEPEDTVPSLTPAVHKSRLVQLSLF